MDNANVGEGANNIARGTGGRNSDENTRIPNNNNNCHSNHNQYKRLTINDANEWRTTRKRKYNATEEDTGYTTRDVINLPDITITRIEAEAEEVYNSRWHVPRLGTMNQRRPDGVYRFMGAQLNSMSSADRRDKKVTDIKRILNDWDIQGGCFQEVGINWSALNYNRNMSSWFRLENSEIRTHTAHNIQENIELSQQGGVAQFLCKDLITFARETESDFRGLGRWSSWLLYASPSHKTRIVTAYNLGKRKSNYLGTVYQQHLRFIQLNGWNITPHELFMTDFLAVIIRWLHAGERLLIFVDMNEHVLQGRLARKLISLGLQEATHPSWGNTEPHTHISGSIPIDGVYHSTTLEVTSTMMLSFHEGVGDHRTTLVDITTRSLLGTDGQRIVRPAARRLTCSNQKSVHRFNKYVEKKLEEHRMHDRLVSISHCLHKDPIDTDGLRRMESLDIQLSQIFIAGEKQCRKINDSDIPFSPPVAYWIHRKRAYQGLLSILLGKCKNVGNTRRRARKAGLDTFNLSATQCIDGIKLCIARLQQLRTQAVGLRKVHLRNCLIAAEDTKDKEKYKGILRVIEREEQRSIWRSIRRVTDDPRLGAITFVQRDTINGRINITDRDEMCEEIQTVTEQRFALAESAPVTNSSLRQSVGFLSDTKFALDLLNNTTAIPSDVDNSTKLVIEEMQRLWATRGHERFNAFAVSSSDYRYFWRRIKESTSSSISGLHFGLYKAAMRSDKITDFLADKITVIGSYGCPPSRWGCGLQVMLEKVAGVALVNKLRAILLMEGDYNFFNKWVFGSKAMDLLYEEGFIPQDQYSQRESTAEDARLDNRITMDISRQLRVPLAAVSVDADKCYDRINHIIMSLALLSIVGAGGLITALLHPIQTMKFYQRTAWGDSSTYMGGRTPSNPLQGLCQGNGAAPACWLIISSLLMHCYSRQGFGSSILSPISLALILFLGEMYVDDTDLIITHPHYLSAQDTKLDTQQSVDAWANMLISTGGSLNPDKCYWYMVDYVCIDGEWAYAPTVDWEVSIPMPDGSRHPIRQLDVNTSQKMLGVWSNPAGDDRKHLDEIMKRYKLWIDRSTNGHLPHRLNWMSYNFKLFPGMRYGLATLASTTEHTSSLLQNLDYKALPLLGVNRSIKREWRCIPRAFGGIGLYNLAIEQMIGWSNMLLQHYGTPTTLGMKCKATLEALQLEIGCLGNPLAECYTSKGILATTSWIAAVWERSQRYNLDFHLAYERLYPPRENDIDIITLLMNNGLSGMDLRRVNRCRLALKAIFLSDLATAGGKYLEVWVMGNDRQGRTSKFQFPRERPSAQDWDLWDAFWENWLLRNRTMPITLGRWIHTSHQSWDWYHDSNTNKLWEHVEEGWACYEFAQEGRNTRTNQIYKPSGLWKHLSTKGLHLASVHCTTNAAFLLDTCSRTFTGNSISRPTFWEFVMQQGGTWMWDHIEGKHDSMNWISHALENNSAIMVTDGSYNQALAPNISGAGWLLVCTKSLRKIQGSFYEESTSASSYRGELLGLTAIHHLVAHVMEYYARPKSTGSMNCDNKGALYQASLKRRRVRNNSKHADLLRNLRYLKGKYNFEVEYHYVKAHQDDIYAYDDLPLIQQLNVICDNLAKQAVQASLLSSIPRIPLEQLLPNEQAVLVIDQRKQTTDVALDLRFQLGMTEARWFFTKPIRIRGETNTGGLGWSPKRFDCIAWETLRDVLAAKPDMYGIWLAKQTVGVCATRRVMARIHGLSDDRCPNCLVGPERNIHLNQCLDPGRFNLLETDINELHGWINATTDPELCYWFIHYLRLRGERKMSSLGEMTPAIAEIALDCDMIGYVDMMHGRLPLSLLRYQQTFCVSVNSRMGGAAWMRKLVTKLLDMSHTQWLFRNFSLHNKIKGHLHLSHRADVLAEIATLSASRPEDIPDESKFLLELEMVELDRASLSQQEYWVTAMKAALAAGRRCSRPKRRTQCLITSTSSATSVRTRRDLHRFRWRVNQILQQMREDLDLTSGSWREKRRRTENDAKANGSNKRFRKPD